MERRKILVLEDEDCIREYLATTLESIGFNVLAASNIQAAKDLVQKDEGKEFTDFLIDLKLPDGPGFEFIEWLSQRVRFSEESRNSVVIISGMFDMIDMDLARSLGVKNILEKPFSKDLLFESLEHYAA